MRPNEDNPNEDYVLQLYEAALKGSVANFTALIRTEPLILNEVSRTSFTETLLHISALAGHLEFTEALLSEKSELASRLDFLGRSPLHLASAEGHTEIVKALLHANSDVCLVHDKEGRIPLHLAVMEGHVVVIQELVNAQPNSVLEQLEGNTVLHLAVKYNQLKALKQLVKQQNNNELFDFTDHLGNTILHTAVMWKQLEMIRYLVSETKIKAKINVLNKMGFSALDLLEHYQRDFKGLQIGDILVKAGGRKSNNLDPNPAGTVPTVVDEAQVKAVKSGFSTFWLKEKTKLVYRKCKGYMKRQSKGFEKMQESLMLVATLTATVSFQAVINPPGGVWQQDYTNITVGYYNCGPGLDYEKCVAGNAVLAYVYPDDYLLFTKFAMISFIASLSVVLLVISGLPLKNKLCTWLMTIAMIFAITFVLLTFIKAIEMVSPVHIYETIINDIAKASYSWVALFGMIAVFATIRLLFWLVSLLKKLIRWERKILPRPTKNQGPIC